jgi:hypothetical protein
MEGLDGVSMEVSMGCNNEFCDSCDLQKRTGGCSGECVEILAAEVQRLRDKLEAEFEERTK